MGRDNSRALSRRQFLEIAAGVAAVPLLAACSPAAAPAATATKPAAAGASPAAGATPAAGASPAPTSGIVRGGSLTSAWTWTYPTLDPHISTMAGNLPGFGAIFNSLVRLELVDAQTWEHDVVGDLAESVEQPDPQTVVFKLKKGIKFHDGSDFNAEVAAWNLLRTRDHEKAFLKAQMANIDAAEAPDASTLRVKLKKANTGFVRNLAYVGSNVPMISKAAIDKDGEEHFARNPVGTGPFKFKEWITDDRIIMEKNPDYFEMGEDGQALPYLDEFISRYIPDPTVSLTDMKAGTIHVLQGILAKDVATVQETAGLVAVEFPWAGEVHFFGGFNQTRAPFDNLKVRQAALHGIDREGMATALGFGVAQAYGLGEWAKGSLGYDESVAQYPYDPAKVKQLLTEAGYPDGIDIELKVIAREPEQTIGEYVQQMWTAVGIRTKLVAQERLSWIDAMRAMNFDTGFWRGNFAYTSTDPDTSRQRITCGSSGNWSQFCDPEIDRLMDEGAAVVDPKERHEAYRKVLAQLQEQAHVYSGYALPLVHAYREEVQGLTFNFNLPDVRAAWLKG